MAPATFLNLFALHKAAFNYGDKSRVEKDARLKMMHACGNGRENQQRRKNAEARKAVVHSEDKRTAAPHIDTCVPRKLHTHSASFCFLKAK